VQGGHTLPKQPTLSARLTPARSGFVSTTFSVEVSKFIIQTCRSKGMTFGNAFAVLGQVALTRVLCRRYIQGDMDKAEWEYRRKEPMTTGGSLNLRPFLNQQWSEQGGSTNVSLYVSFFFYTLPFMPLGSCFGLLPGDTLPDFQQLLSPARFWMRCSSVMQQSRSLRSHPLFPYCSMLDRVGARREAAQRWEMHRDEQELDDHIVPSMGQGGLYGLVMSHGGSSLGNVSLFVILYSLVAEVGLD
jgi:hypothetical protein